jgi:hypothetical protein
MTYKEKNSTIIHNPKNNKFPNLFVNHEMSYTSNERYENEVANL